MSNTEASSPFHPRVLGDLEAEVMEVLWTAPVPLHVKEVQARLRRQLAYTTVMTTLDRLYRKGLLDRERTGLAFRYQTALSRAEFHQRLVTGLLGDLLPETGDAILAAFVDMAAEVDEANLERLAVLVDAKRRGRQG